MITNEEIDAILLDNVTTTWRKVSRVVGMAMMRIDRDQRLGLDDLYFAERIETLVRRGSIEHCGDLAKIREGEIRLPLK